MTNQLSRKPLQFETKLECPRLLEPDGLTERQKRLCALRIRSDKSSLYHCTDCRVRPLTAYDNYTGRERCLELGS